MILQIVYQKPAKNWELIAANGPAHAKITTTSMG